MNTDAFFWIGKTHAICQDYAEAGPDHVIISDGCSSSPESNIGAILISRAAKLYLCKFPYHDLETMCQSVLATAYTYSKSMELHEDSLCATLGTLKTEDTLKFAGMLYGDGVMAGRRRGQLIWDISVFEFTSGAPFYMRYNLDPACEERYLKEFGTESKRTVYELTLTSQGFKYELKGVHTNKDVTDGSLGPFYMSYLMDRYDMSAIMSDGVNSFSKLVTTQTSKRNESVHICEVLAELLNFKNYNGQFVQRRVKAACRKFSEENWSNADDVSLGAIYCANEVE